METREKYMIFGFIVGVALMIAVFLVSALINPLGPNIIKFHLEGESCNKDQLEVCGEICNLYNDAAEIIEKQNDLIEECYGLDYELIDLGNLSCEGFQ